MHQPEQRKKAQDTENSTGQLLVTTGRVGANADECQTHITTDTEHSNMECSCNVGIDGDNDDFLGYSERTLKAGRKHTCVECGKEIKKGEQFVFISIFEIERIGNFKLCLDCHAVSKQFFADGWIFGQMWDNLGDYLFYNWKDDLPSNCISKLPPPARDRVCDQLQDFQEAAI